MDDLQSLRRRMREYRAALDPHARLQAAGRAAQHALGLPALADAQRIAAYIAVNGELDPAPLLARLRTQGKQIFLPVLGDTADTGLRFAPYPEHVSMHPNRLGIPEPECAARQLLDAVELDIVFAPLVAFDGQGNRAGMGGGYYDRTFAFLRAAGKGPVLAGLGYAFQRVDKLPVRSWDIPLHAVATDQELLLVAATDTSPTP